MHDKFQKRKDRIELFQKIEKIHQKAREVHKTATVLNQHCHIFINSSPQIYNISSLTEYLENLSDSLFHDLCKLLDAENPPETPEFIKRFVPIPPEILDVDEEWYEDEDSDESD